MMKRRLGRGMRLYYGSKLPRRSARRPWASTRSGEPEHHVVFVDVAVGEFEGARFGAVDDEPGRLVEPARGRIVAGDGKLDLLDPRPRLDRGDRRVDERLAGAAA